MARCACLGTVWGINGGASVGGPPIDRYGTEAQKQKYLAPLLRGLQRHCLCITEPAGKTIYPYGLGTLVLIILQLDLTWPG